MCKCVNKLINIKELKLNISKLDINVSINRSSIIKYTDLVEDSKIFSVMKSG